MDLMADAIAGFGKEDTVFRSKCLQKSMVIRILKPGLEHIVVDITD
jgi:hypothetical protein